MKKAIALVVGQGEWSVYESELKKKKLLSFLLMVLLGWGDRFASCVWLQRGDAQ